MSLRSLKSEFLAAQNVFRAVTEEIELRGFTPTYYYNIPCGFALRVPFPNFQRPLLVMRRISSMGSKIDHLRLDQIGEVLICNPDGFDVASGLKDDVGLPGEGGIDVDLEIV